MPDRMVHGAAVRNARSMIRAGDIDRTSPWSFTAEDSTAALGAGGDNWTGFGLQHLGEDALQAKDSKPHWKYPYAKGGKLHVSALRYTTISARANGDTAIAAEAAALLDLCSDDKPPAMTARATIAQANNYRVIRAASGEAATIYLYGVIGLGGFFDPEGITADGFAKDLKALGNVKTIDVRVNSEGGDVFQAKAIYALLVAHPAKVNIHIDGLAASAASFIAMAGDHIEASEGAFVMIHNAQGFTMGDWQEHERVIGLLKSVDETMVDLYANKTGLDRKDITNMMNEETWLNAKEALAKGFIDSIATKDSKVAACVSRFTARYRHVPAALRANRQIAQELLDDLNPTLA